MGNRYKVDAAQIKNLRLLNKSDIEVNHQLAIAMTFMFFDEMLALYQSELDYYSHLVFDEQDTFKITKKAIHNINYRLPIIAKKLYGKRWTLTNKYANSRTTIDMIINCLESKKVFGDFMDMFDQVWKTEEIDEELIYFDNDILKEVMNDENYK